MKKEKKKHASLNGKNQMILSNPSNYWDKLLNVKVFRLGYLLLIVMFDDSIKFQLPANQTTNQSSLKSQVMSLVED